MCIYAYLATLYFLNILISCYAQILPAVLNSLQLAADILSKLSAHETALALAPSGVLFGSVQGSKENGASASNRGQVSKNVARKGKDVEEVSK